MLYLSIFFILTLSAYVFYILFTHYKYLSRQNYEISENYNSFFNFRNTIKVVVKFYLKRVVKLYNFLTHYLVLLAIKGLENLQTLFSIIYKRMINSFLEKSIENKSYVKFFWKDLKKFKKEIDSESDL